MGRRRLSGGGSRSSGRERPLPFVPEEKVAEPVPRVFDGTELRIKVYVDEAKPGAVAFGPFEIVHEGPGEEAFYIDPFLFGPEEGEQVLLVVVDTGLVVDGAIDKFIPEGGAAFADDDLFYPAV